jgi:hypothetical protein
MGCSSAARGIAGRVVPIFVNVINIRSRCRAAAEWAGAAPSDRVLAGRRARRGDRHRRPIPPVAGLARRLLVRRTPSWDIATDPAGSRHIAQALRQMFGSEGAELMWLVMRGAMDRDVVVRHTHFVPASMTSAGMIVMEECRHGRSRRAAPSPPTRRRGPHEHDLLADGLPAGPAWMRFALPP